MTNDELYDKALQAATDLFGDMRVSKAECRRNLQSLIDEIEVMIYSLGEDEEEND